MKQINFEASPLITPERLAADLGEAFSNRPPFVQNWAIVDDPELDLDDAWDQLPPVVSVVGGKHKKAITMSAYQTALVWELCRLGHRLVTNSNFGKPAPKIYVRISFRDVPGDLTTLARIFIDAGLNEEVKTIDLASDLRLHNLAKQYAGKPSKKGMEVALRHAGRLAKEREASETLPTGFSVSAYLNNLHKLVEQMAAEAKMLSAA